MAEPKVWTFFYGSFINLDVLKKVDYVPERYEVAKLAGFDIRISPLANLVRSDQHCVYGIVATATHEELRRLYDYAPGRHLDSGVPHRDAGRRRSRAPASLVHLYAPPTLTTMKVPDEAEEALRELPGLAKMPGHPLGQEGSCTQLVEEEAFRWRRCR